MIRAIKGIITLLLFFCTALSVGAQSINDNANTAEVNKKLGKPTMEEMTMTEYALDPEAEAVVLMQSCNVTYEMASMYSMTVNYDCKIRIKVLKDEGKKYGDFAIPFYSNTEEASIEEDEFYEFSATAYNLNDKGKIVPTKMTAQQIRDERINNRYKVRKFSVPQVQKGSIIEVHYQMVSPRFYYIYDYDMQKNIPIAYERYFMQIPAVLQFNVEAPIKRKNVKANVTYDYITIKNSDPKNQKRCNANCYEVEAFQMPALRKVSHVWNVDDYAAKVTCDLKSTQFPGVEKRGYGMTWEQADRLILEQDQIGPKLDDKSKLRDELKSAMNNEQLTINNFQDEKKLIGAAVLFLASHVTWDGKYYNIPDYASAIIKKKSGNSADVNLMFINIMNDLGFTAYPVYLSTRRHGRLPIHPSANAFNTFIVAVETKEGTCYVDATDPYGAVNVLNPNLYVSTARKIGKKIAGSWVDLTKSALHKTAYVSTLAVSANGTITGELTARYSKNSAKELKEEYHSKKDSLAYVQSFQEKHGITIESLQMNGHDQYGDEVNSAVKFQIAAEATDDHIYIKPIVFNPMGESPFKEEARDLPVELPYPVNISYFADIRIPEGYEVEETLKGYEVTVPDHSMTAKMSCQSVDGKVRLTYSFVCKKMNYEAEEYDAIKKVYEMACQSMDDMIVLKKK